METITGQEVGRGDVVVQVVQIGLALLNRPMVIQGIDEEHRGVVLGETLEGPPRTDLYGSVKLYQSEKFMKL